MGRGPRIQYEGALYHVINRGNFKRDIFETDGARRTFEACLFEGCALFGLLLHAFAIMRNHFHLATETPRANLAAAMQWIESSFAARFIRYRSERGHLFESRYKAPLLEPGPALRRVVNYIHLNPVRAGASTLPALDQYRWGSCHWFKRPDRPAFLTCTAWHQELGIADDVAGWSAYQNHLAWLLADVASHERDEKELTRGWAIGSPAWKQEVADKRSAVVGRQHLRLRDRNELNEGIWTAALDHLLRSVPVGRADLNGPKSAAWKIEVALALRQSVGASNAWIARRLNMGTPDSVSVCLSKERQRKRHDARSSDRGGLAPNG